MPIITESLSESPLPDLSARFAALKEKHNTEIADRDLASKEFPLWALLMIYEKANRECYIEYMAGFKLLVKWLSPIKFYNYDPSLPFLNLTGGYETQQVADILNTSRLAILECVNKEVMPLMIEHMNMNINESNTEDK